ncbi:MAG: hypothetical protein IT259_08490 [Saprospiraceae bacterium]|nr:hypothetical protein [Saprospiraceae bacterium]
MKAKYLLALPLLFLSFLLNAQDDLLEGLEQEDNSPVLATFKGTRLINHQTVEVPGRRTLDFRIAHRFGAFNSGWYDFFGFDNGASIRFGLEYSYDGRLQFGIGRTSIDKVGDGFLKYRLLRQHPNGWKQVSVTLFTSAYYTMRKDPDKEANGFDKYENWTSRLSYAHQIIIGRKFDDRLSLQIAPTMIHYNLVDRISDKNDVFVLAAAGRYKFTKRAALTLEYGWRINEYTRTQYYDSFSVGLDVETGGHVFQMFLTNSPGLTEPQFFAQTTDQWKDMGIRFGFNISRVFTL